MGVRSCRVEFARLVVSTLNCLSLLIFFVFSTCFWQPSRTSFTQGLTPSPKLNALKSFFFTMIAIPTFHRRPCNPGPPLTGVSRALRARNPERVSRDRSKKCPKQSQNSLRSLKTVYFETPETVSRLFRTLFGPRGRKAPWETLWRLL